MDTIDLIILSKQGDRAARNRVVTENVGLVWNVVRRFLNRGHEAEDLFQIGCIGLMKAVDKFDTSYEVKFSTYAVPMIVGEIKRFLRDDGMVKVSRTLKENGQKVRRAGERINMLLGREPTLDEVAKETGLTREEVAEALEAGSEIESLQRSVYQNDGSELLLEDKIADMNENSFYCTDSEKEGLLNSILIKQLMEELNERERELLRLRFFCNKTQNEVAKRLGVSQVQVSRTEKKILLQMREKIVG